jgi:hypothetical protein
MSPRQTFLISVASSLTATVVVSIASALAHARLDLSLGAAVVAVALICGMGVFGVLAWREQSRLRRELARIERAAWPAWMHDIAYAALSAGLRVFSEGQFVVFQRPTGDRHLLLAQPPGLGLGQTLERHKALEVLGQWGVPVRTGTRGQLLPAVGVAWTS